MDNIDDEEYAHDWEEEEEEQEEAEEDDDDDDDDDDVEEEEEEDVEVEVPDANNIAACFVRRERQLFERQCNSLQQNKPSLKGFDRDWSGDDNAIRLGNSLMGNTHLEWLWVPLGPGLTAKGAEALALGIHYSRIRRLEISGESAWNSSITRILYLEAIQKVPCLTLSYPLRDVDAIELGQSLKGNTIVQELQIRVDELTPLGAQELSAGIFQSQIKRLDLMVEDGSDDVPEVKRILLLHAVQQSHFIRHLDLSGGSCVVDALASSVGSLQSLKLYGSLDVIRGIQALSDSLVHATNLTTLCLNSCGLGDHEMSILSAGVHKSASIKKLSLSKNEIGDQGIASFLEHWDVNSSIQALDLGRNAIGPVGAQQLMRAVANQRNLLELTLELNGNIGFDGMRLVGNELSNLKLRKLYVDGCANWIHHANENSAAAKAQVRARDGARQAIIQGIRGNVYLHQIRVYFLENFQEQIQFYLNLNKRGRYLLMSGNNYVTPGIWSQVFAKCRNDPSALFFFVRELPTLFASTEASPRKRRRFF